MNGSWVRYFWQGCWALGHEWETLDPVQPLRAGGTRYRRRCTVCGVVECRTLNIDS
jgi:hypothetical protein